MKRNSKASIKRQERQAALDSKRLRQDQSDEGVITRADGAALSKVDQLKTQISENENFLSEKNGWNQLTLLNATSLMTPPRRPTLVPMDLVFDIKPGLKKKLLEAPIGTVKRLGGAQQVVPIPPFVKSSVFQVPLNKSSTSKLPPGMFFSESSSLVMDGQWFTSAHIEEGKLIGIISNP